LKCVYISYLFNIKHQKVIKYFILTDKNLNLSFAYKFKKKEVLEFYFKFL